MSCIIMECGWCIFIVFFVAVFVYKVSNAFIVIVILIFIISIILPTSPYPIPSYINPPPISYSFSTPKHDVSHLAFLI